MLKINKKFSVIILAAGEGSRMNSSIPKVLHHLAHQPLLEHVVNAVLGLKPENIYIIFGKDRPQVREKLDYLPVTWVQQDEQLGTAHAVLQALPFIPDDQAVLILYGDGPLITTQTLKKLLNTSSNNIAWLTAIFADPSGLGRIVRDLNQRPLAIIEEKEASTQQKRIQEINTGISFMPAAWLKKTLTKINNHNQQREYYLTDAFSIAIEQNIPIDIIQADEDEVSGINDRIQLAKAERIYQMKAAEKLMQQGVTLRDPQRFDLRGEMSAGRDVVIDVNVIIEGKVQLGNKVIIGPNVYLRDVIIKDNAEIKANTMIEESEIGEACQVGPFARIRPGTQLAAEAKIGNFVEVKKSVIGEKSKVNHLSYIGDTTMGKNVNIGAGTITCNYDGANKNPTIIEDNVHIGSNNNLVAPIKIGTGATTGSGSTLTKDAPAGKLTVARAKQMTLDGWQRPAKKNKE